MHKSLGLFCAFLLLAATAAATPCTPSATSLCLSGGRFDVSVAWKDFQGNTGEGKAVALTADTGYFWFFNDSNVELIVKVLDATTINGKFWVFFGALSNVEYTLTVRDSVTGATKTYQNPSGQFASVGDTTAFDGASGALTARHESVTVSGTPAPPASIAEIQRFLDVAAPAAPDFTPCADDGSSLFLSNCRFRVDVHWADSSGHSGSGQPVPLSGDTGYFWFFSDTNVELVVKVLDARAIGGNFWVFFGALSNVEYTVFVTDTVSGELHAYHNPPNTFASVGDTAAFRGGYGISMETEDALAVSGTITAANGGSISATASDGTIFTLNVPANAIPDDQEVVMTPASAVGAFPFAGGLAAGVDLRPAGLVLVGGASLSIHTPVPLSRAEETPVAWNGSGEDFFLFPPDPADGDLSLQIFHLGGYGVARGTDAERTTQLAREPVADDDLLAHRISPLLRAGRTSAAGIVAGPRADTTDWREAFKAAMDVIYESLENDMTLYDGEPGEFLSVAESVLQWKARVEHDLGPLDTVFPGRAEEIHSLLTAMMKRALHVVHDRCSADVSSIRALPELRALARLLALDVQVDIEATLGCMTFRLRFDSTVNFTGGGSGVIVTEKVSGVVTLRSTSTTLYPAGDGTLTVTGSIAGLPRECSYRYTEGPGAMRALLHFPNIFRGEGPLRTDGLYYKVALPHSEFDVSCPGSAPFFGDVWLSGYIQLHLQDRDTGDSWLQTGFSFSAQGNPWAKASPQGNMPNLGLKETTSFIIDHTPE